MCAALRPMKRSTSNASGSTWRSDGLLRDAVAAGAEHLFDVEIFPVCAPRLARERARPLKTPSDLSHHVILDFDTVTGRGRWSDWQQWLAGLKLDGLKPAGTLRFSHFDQVMQAAINGSGIAMGRSPHNARHLREGLLVAPFGSKETLGFGRYVAVIAERSKERPVVRKFCLGCAMKSAKIAKLPPRPQNANADPPRCSVPARSVRTSAQGLGRVKTCHDLGEVAMHGRFSGCGVFSNCWRC